MTLVDPGDAESPLALALDLGSSSFRALIFDRQGRAVAGTEVQIAYQPLTTPDGGVEMDGPDRFNLLGECLDGVAIQAGSLLDRVAVVGATSFWHSLIGLDANGEPATPVFSWADTRCADQVDLLRAEFDQDAVHRRTGAVIHSSYWPAKLRWLRDTRGEMFRTVARWTSFADYAYQRLFGVDQTAIGMASATGLFNQRAADWDRPFAEALSVDPARLPRLVERNAAARGLRPAFASRWPALNAIPWMPPLGDGACANVGVGAIGGHRIALTLGTSGALRVILPRPMGADLEWPRDLWAYRLDHERLVVGAAISNGGAVAAWLGGLFDLDPESEEWRLAATMEPDGHGLTMLPFLAGERSPIWNAHATAAIVGLTLHTSRADVTRAGLEAVALRLSRLYDAVSRVADVEHEIVANGGAILGSDLWRRIIVNAIGHPVRPLPPGDESTARGAALLALNAIGALADLAETPDLAAADPLLPDPAAAAVYRRARDRQHRLENLLFPSGGSWES